MKFDQIKDEVYLDNTGTDAFGDHDTGFTGNFGKEVLPRNKYLGKDGKIDRRKFYKYYKKWHSEREEDRSFQFLANHDKPSNI